ncbi:hypothetical protein, partial [Bacillus subtilis]
HNSTYNFGVDPNNQNIEQRTTNLFKDLSNDSSDQMILFNALMLYAKEYNPSIYDKYINQEDLKDDNQEDLNDDNNE